MIPRYFSPYVKIFVSYNSYICPKIDETPAWVLPVSIVAGVVALGVIIAITVVCLKKKNKTENSHALVSSTKDGYTPITPESDFCSLDTPGYSDYHSLPTPGQN